MMASTAPSNLNEQMYRNVLANEAGLASLVV